MPLDPAFIADCPYAPEALLLDEILEVDRERSLVRARMPTHDELPLTRDQRVHPQRHPRHVAGGLMVHMTGMMGFAHAYFVLGLRHADGWIGYGARIDRARFVALAPPGAPIEISCRGTQVRVGSKRTLGRYEFRFVQNGTLLYESDQTALWTRIET
jgi:hypothetical protein